MAADNGDNATHRMYVLEGTSQDPQQPFVLKGKIAAPSDRWAIDGTVLEMPDGKRTAIGIAVSHRCDLLVAAAQGSGDAARVQGAALKLLESAELKRWMTAAMEGG